MNEANETVPLMTVRGQEWGFEYFGNFIKSLYSVFQLLTGESWSEAIARPMIHVPKVFNMVCHTLFFVSFVLVDVFVLTNVFVAVLIDKFLAGGDGEDGEVGDLSDSSSDEEGSEDGLARSPKEPGSHQPQHISVACLILEVKTMRHEMREVRSQIASVRAIIHAREQRLRLAAPQDENGYLSPDKFNGTDFKSIVPIDRGRPDKGCGFNGKELRTSASSTDRCNPFKAPRQTSWCRWLFSCASPFAPK